MQGAAAFVGFVGRAVDVEWAGGDALRLPTGQGAVSRLARHLPLERLFTAGESAFDGSGYDRLVVTGVDIADRALRLAGRPTGLRLQGSTRMLRGASTAGGFTGRARALAASAARPLGRGLIAGLSIGTELAEVEARNRQSSMISQGWTAAAQLGWRMSPETTLSITAGASIAGRDIASHGGRVTADTTAQRDFVALHAEHALEANGFRLSPSGTLQFATEQQNAYTDSSGARVADRIQSYGRLSAEVEVGYQLDVGRGDLDLYANVRGDWDFVHPDRVTLATGRWSHDLSARAQVASGVTIRSAGGFASTVEISNNVIGAGGPDGTTLRGSLGFDF